MKKLIIVGAGAFAEVAMEYFNEDSEYSVVGFAVERQHMTTDRLIDLPVHPLEDITDLCPALDHFFYVALTYNELNRLRTRLFDKMKSLGYRPASYISSSAFVANSAQLLEHCFIMEGNVIQPHVKISENVVLWSGNHIGHHSKIGPNCFISSHAVISGFCTLNRNCFVGVNATISNNVEVGEDNWIGPTCNILSSTDPNQIYKMEKSQPARIPARRFFKVTP